ncbi:hypothetical protein QNO09_12840 [Streptomyces sp. 378]|uniref:hypothetical protein n=1 Tax=Streptomyces sp. 378 TaxID=3049412 RepID=UPI0024C32331|nr:hypothetical protein [Streptomyces sp. 378]MDK1344173.1 hypothetical protein [Streptomyces sp. 378]
MSSHVEEQVRARIAAVRAKAEADRRRRQELAEARQHGLAARHAQKLQRQDGRGADEDDQDGEQQDSDTVDGPTEFRPSTGGGSATAERTTPCP